MTLAIVAVLAVVVGAVVGFLLRSHSVESERSSERALAQAEKVAVEQRLRDADAALAAARQQIAQLQAESAARAGFESLAVERQSAIDRLTSDLTESRNSAQLQQQQSEDTKRTQAARISELEAQLDNEKKKTDEKIALLEKAEASFANQFQALANKVLDEKSKTFAEGSQKEIGTLLNPLRVQIEDFRKKVEDAQKDSNTGVTKLETLVNALNSMNQQISEDARNLTTALRGSSKTQGDWGEFILRDLLEKAGLHEGEQYTFQQSFSGVESEDGGRPHTVRTDVIVSLPGGRSLVIDSKVSLTAYTDFVSATDDEARKAALKAHLASVRGHITGLSKAGYHRLPGVEAPDFVVLFVPIEPAFLLALQSDTELWAEAYKQGILLVGPTTLLYVIRIVHVLWQQELQSRNVQDVIDRGTALYEKFVGFVTDMQSIGDNLRRTDTSYTNAMKKLSEGAGNLIGQVEKLKKLGLRTTKSLPKNLLDRADVEEEPTLLSIAAGEDGAAQNN
ncbi:MAG: DNA recombination protein RmuC [Terracidiphilus sp.]|nr:DNA recombination protein RmuC [Terracidiphilus sp.]